MEITPKQESGKGRVLIVDDNKANIDILIEALKHDFKLGIATNGRDALEHVRRHMPDLVLLDVVMPGIDGYEVCRTLKSDDRTRDIPVVFITAMTEIESKSRGFEVGGIDYITRPFEIMEVKARVRTHISLKQAREALENQNHLLEERVRERTLELRDTQIEIVYRLGRAAEYRDNETGFHLRRMSWFCALLGKAAGMNREECENLLHASPMHDIGKIGIPDEILLKPGKLDYEEWGIMKTHTTIGAEILSGHSSRLLRTAETIALTHHEKWDGTGYPNNLRGNAIPLVGRITALCDVFDALTSRRPYKDAWPVRDAVEEIRRSSGTHFDPDLVKAFLGILQEIVEVRDRFPDRDQPGRERRNK